MNLVEFYIWVKAFHIVAALLFVSGVLLAAVVLAGLPNQGGEVVQSLISSVRRWDRRVTTPAMLSVWALGLFLGLTGGWFHSGWLFAKLVFVVALSALHGVMSARLRLADSGRPFVRVNWAAPAAATLAASIAVLATTKV